jgi:hypothetical protein
MMNRAFKILTFFAISITLFSCEDEIFPALPDAEAVTVIDAWINNLPEQQVIRVKRTLPYFQAQELPGIRNADVSITDSRGKVYQFIESEIEEGNYYWQPDQQDTAFGEIGLTYTLDVGVGNNHFQSLVTLDPVPEIDSINFRFEKGNSFFPDSYFASFYAVDLPGEGDTYWIRAYKNGEFLNKPGEINIAYDAAFNAGSLIDGITFIQPIRDGVNPFDQDEEDNFLSPYEPGDSLYVEIHSISNEAFIFLNELIIQTDRPGGFAELFAQPLSNVSTNIVNTTGDEKVVGFFNVAAVSSAGRKLDPENLPRE